jgi:hypothetical protein
VFGLSIVSVGFKQNKTKRRGYRTYHSVSRLCQRRVKFRSQAFATSLTPLNRNSAVANAHLQSYLRHSHSLAAIAIVGLGPCLLFGLHRQFRIAQRAFQLPLLHSVEGPQIPTSPQLRHGEDDVQDWRGDLEGYLPAGPGLREENLW